MTDAEKVKQKWPSAQVTLNQHAYIDGFSDIPYQIVVCGETINGMYMGPIYLAQDCRTEAEAWSDAAQRLNHSPS